MQWKRLRNIKALDMVQGERPLYNVGTNMFGIIILFILTIVGLLTAIFTHYAVNLNLFWLWSLLEAFPPKDAYGRPGKLDYQALRHTGFYKVCFYGYRVAGSVVFIGGMVLIGFALFE